jgi:hypothetical protein
MRRVVGQGIAIALVVLFSSVCFMVGLITELKPLIGLGLLLLALCAIYGSQPGWPARRS